MDFNATPFQEIKIDGKKFQEWLVVKSEDYQAQAGKWKVLTRLTRFANSLVGFENSGAFFKFTENFFSRTVLDPVLLVGFPDDTDGEGNYRNEELDQKLYSWSEPCRDFLKKGEDILTAMVAKVEGKPEKIEPPQGVPTQDEFIALFNSARLKTLVDHLIPEMVFGGAYLAIENVMISVWILGNFGSLPRELPVGLLQSVYFWNWLLVVKFLYLYNLALWSIRQKERQLNAEMTQNLRFIFNRTYWTISLGRDPLARLSDPKAKRPQIYSSLELPLNVWLTYRPKLKQHNWGNFFNFFHLLSVKNVEVVSCLTRREMTGILKVFQVAAPVNPFIYREIHTKESTPSYDLFGQQMLNYKVRTPPENMRHFIASFLQIVQYAFTGPEKFKDVLKKYGPVVEVVAEALSFFGIAAYYKAPGTVKDPTTKKPVSAPDDYPALPQYQVDMDVFSKFLEESNSPDYFVRPLAIRAKNDIQKTIHMAKGFDHSLVDRAHDYMLQAKIKQLTAVYGRETVAHVDTTKEIGFDAFHKEDENLGRTDMDSFVVENDEIEESEYSLLGDSSQLLIFKFSLPLLQKRLVLIDRFFPAETAKERDSFLGFAYDRVFTSWIADFLAAYPGVSVDDFNQQGELGDRVFTSSVNIFFYGLTGDSSYIFRSGSSLINQDVLPEVKSYLRKKAIFLYLNCVANKPNLYEVATRQALLALDASFLPEGVIHMKPDDLVCEDPKKAAISAIWKKLISDLKTSNLLTLTEDKNWNNIDKVREAFRGAFASSIFPFTWEDMEKIIEHLVDPRLSLDWNERPWKISVSSPQMQLTLSNLLSEMASGVSCRPEISHPLKSFLEELDEGHIVGLLRGDYFSLRGNGTPSQVIQKNRGALVRWCNSKGYAMEENNKQTWECNLYAVPRVYDLCYAIVARFCLDFWHVFLRYAEGPFRYHSEVDAGVTDRLRSKACSLEIIRAMRKIILSPDPQKAVEECQAMSEFIDDIYSNTDYGADSFRDILTFMGGVLVSVMTKEDLSIKSAFRIFKAEFEEFTRFLSAIDSKFFFPERPPRQSKDWIDKCIFLTRRWEWPEGMETAGRGATKSTDIISVFIDAKGEVGNHLLLDVLVLNKFLLRNEDASFEDGIAPLENRVLALLELMALDDEFLRGGEPVNRLPTSSEYQRGPFASSPYWMNRSRLIVDDWNQVFYDFSQPRGKGFHTDFVTQRWNLIENFVQNRVPQILTSIKKRIEEISPRTSNWTCFPSTRDYQKSIFSLIGESNKDVDLFILSAAALVSPSGDHKQRKGYLGLVGAYMSGLDKGQSKAIASCISLLVEKEYRTPLSASERGKNKFRVALNVVEEELEKEFYLDQGEGSNLTAGKKRGRIGGDQEEEQGRDPETAGESSAPAKKRQKKEAPSRKVLKDDLDALVTNLPKKTDMTYTLLTAIWGEWRTMVQNQPSLTETEKIFDLAMVPDLFAVDYFKNLVDKNGIDEIHLAYYEILLSLSITEAIIKVQDLAEGLLDTFLKLRVELRSSSKRDVEDHPDRFHGYLEAMGACIRSDLMRLDLDEMLRPIENKLLNRGNQAVFDIKKRLGGTEKTAFIVWSVEVLELFVSEKRKFLKNFFPGSEAYTEAKIRGIFSKAISDEPSTEGRVLFQDLVRTMISVVLSREYASSEKVAQDLVDVAILSAPLSAEDFSYPVPHIGQFPRLPMLHEDVRGDFPTRFECIVSGIDSLRETSYPDPNLFFSNKLDFFEDTSKETGELEKEKEKEEDEEEEEEKEEEEEEEEGFMQSNKLDDDDDDDDGDFVPPGDEDSDDEELDEEELEEAEKAEQGQDEEEDEGGREKSAKERMDSKKKSQKFIGSIFPLKAIEWDNIQSQNSYLPLSKFPKSWKRLLLHYAPRQGFDPKKPLSTENQPSVANSIDEFKKDFDPATDKVVLSNYVWTDPPEASLEFKYIKEWVSKDYRSISQYHRAVRVYQHLASINDESLQRMNDLLERGDDAVCDLASIYDHILGMDADKFLNFFQTYVNRDKRRNTTDFLVICVLRIATSIISSGEIQRFVDTARSSNPESDQEWGSLYQCEL